MLRDVLYYFFIIYYAVFLYDRTEGSSTYAVVHVFFHTLSNGIYLYNDIFDMADCQTASCCVRMLCNLIEDIFYKLYIYVYLYVHKRT